jgi:hypothetical protein
MTKKLIATAALFLAFSAPAFAETWTGLVSDQMCGAKHDPHSKADIECAQKCFKAGSPAVFVIGVKVYKIENQVAVKKHLGHSVTITGTMNGDTIHVDSVKA